MTGVKYIILSETILQSIVKDAFSVLSALTMIGIGWVIGSSAMQWLGFLLWFCIAAQMSISKKFTTAEAAIAYLKSLPDDAA